MKSRKDIKWKYLKNLIRKEGPSIVFFVRNTNDMSLFI